MTMKISKNYAGNKLTSDYCRNCRHLQLNPHPVSFITQRRLKIELRSLHVTTASEEPSLILCKHFQAVDIDTTKLVLQVYRSSGIE